VEVFAVAMNITSRQVVVEVQVVIGTSVLLGVQHFEQRRRRVAAEVGRHLVDLIEQESPGCLGAGLLELWMILPGIAPMYVRRWPRISASSRTPPSDMRTNLRPIARAIDGQRGLAHARAGPRGTGSGPQLLHQRLHREVLDDALFDLLEPVVVLVEDCSASSMSCLSSV
jgi:hypothetical protein